MNYIFCTFLDKFVMVYLDNIIIYNMMMEEHLEHLLVVFNVLWVHRLYLPTKCVFDT